MSATDDLIAGRYRLVRRVGSGAMGVVWEAWDDRLHRAVAVKQLHAQHGLSDADAELATLRAMREARITARLDHPNAVPVFDVVEHEGRPCLIMQFLPSSPLSAVLKERTTLPTLESARIVGQVASALAAAHQVGIVHRDVKPGNILIAEDGTARISDFGISHALGDATLTSTGLVHGTPAFMAPEIARGGESSAAADVFGLGATLYAMLEGKPPFGSDPNSIALLHRVAAGQFTRPRQGGAVTPLLLQMLAPDPADRPTMNEVAQYLGGLTTQGPDATPTVALQQPEGGAGRPEVTTVLPKPERSTPQPVPAPVAEAFAWEHAPTPPPSDPPPVSPSPSPGDRSERRPVRVVVVVAIVAAVAVALALLLPQLTADQGNTVAPQPEVSDTGQGVPSPSAPASSPVPSASASATPGPTESAKSATPSTSPTSSSGSATAEELAGAITHYYALMPDEVNEGWTLLTRSYQNGQSGGRQSYKRFWGNVDRVTVSQVKGIPPDRAQATVVYVFDDGRVVTERTEFRLVDVNGTLKIDHTNVLSSSTS